MSPNKPLIVALFLLCATWSPAQQRDARAALEQTLESRYRLTTIGGGFMGVHGDNSVRRAGGVVVLLRDGLYGSKDRSRLTSNAIRNGAVDIFSGDKDFALKRGEKFYVTAIHVGSEVVTMGLVSVRTIPLGPKAFPAWCSVNFFFPEETVTQRDLQTIYRVMDGWLIPEDAIPSTASVSALPASNATVSAQPIAPESSKGAIELKPGMTRDEITSMMGAPLQDVQFADRRWLTYQAITAALQDGKLISVEANGTELTSVRISSDPNGADIFLDGKFVSSAPALLRLRPATYKVTVRTSGYADWEREVKVLPNAEVNLNAKLNK